MMLVLIAEDDVATRLTLSTLVKQLGHKVLEENDNLVKPVQQADLEEKFRAVGDNRSMTRIR